MRLHLLAEDVADVTARLQQKLKEGAHVAQSSLAGLTNDPVGLYWHILKGASNTKELIIKDQQYWRKMFRFWPYVDEVTQGTFHGEITRLAHQRLQKYTAESIEPTNPTNPNEKATKFTQWLKTMAISVANILNNNTGQQLQPQKVLANINAEAVIAYTNRCVEASGQTIQKQQNKQREQEMQKSQQEMQKSQLEMQKSQQKPQKVQPSRPESTATEPLTQMSNDPITGTSGLGI